MIKPTLRIDAKYDMAAALENLIKNSDPIYKSCLNCDNFNEQMELCKLVNQRPPARVIAYGCPKWSDKDEIPF